MVSVDGGGCVLGQQSDSVLLERVADMLAENDACGPGPVSRQEYLDDAVALIALVRAEGGLLPRTDDRA